MSTKDFIKKSVLNAFVQYDAPKLAVALLAALGGACAAFGAAKNSARPAWWRRKCPSTLAWTMWTRC